MNSKTRITYSIGAIAAVIVLFASGPIVATHQAQAFGFFHRGFGFHHFGFFHRGFGFHHFGFFHRGFGWGWGWHRPWWGWGGSRCGC